MSSFLKHRVLLIDDERTTLRAIEGMLQQHNFAVDAFSDPREAVAAFERDDYDIVLSDFYMPEMNGDEVLRAVRAVSSECPFLFLTVDSNLKQAVKLIQSGADDYIVKPIDPDVLVFRVRRSLEVIRRRQKETNWQELYAAKDIRQTEKMIDQLSKAINQAGGYLWLDLLKEELQHPEDGKYSVTTEVADMVLETAEVQKQILEYITLIADTNRTELSEQEMAISDLLQQLSSFCRNRLESEMGDYARRLAVGVPGVVPRGTVRVDSGVLQQVMNELLINAVKFSPAGSRIVLTMDIVHTSGHPLLGITIQNNAAPSPLTGEDGLPAVGIPPGYEETIFDLFFSSEDFRNPLPYEEWPNGAGLYIARKLVKRQGGWIRSGMGTDHTGDTAAPVVRMTVLLPVV